MKSATMPLAGGFRLATFRAGFKKANHPDLSLVVSDFPAAGAGVFTTNLFKAAPVLVAMKHLAKGAPLRAIVVNTGQANACTGTQGLENCNKTLALVAQATGLSPEEILPASTGVIGAQLKMEAWEKAVPGLCANLGQAGVEDLATAIMTTDKGPKMAAATCEIEGKTITLTGVAKGAGMICPNMATMISLVLCDAAVERAEWQAMFSRAVRTTFNRATVDGDTSTNDSLFGLANGASGVTVQGEALIILEAALEDVLAQLAYKLVEDGEGATKVLHITVRGTDTEAAAEQAARTVGHSQLVKTAMYGKDANWGRIVAALGRSGVHFAPEAVRVSLCGVMLFEKGQPTSLDFDALLKEPLEGTDIAIDIVLGSGPAEYTLLASDLTHEYISINADYRS